MQGCNTMYAQHVTEKNFSFLFDSGQEAKGAGGVNYSKLCEEPAAAQVSRCSMLHANIKDNANINR